LTLKLRDEAALEMALEKEFNRFKMEERRQTEKTLRQGKILNFIGTALVVLLFIGVMAFAVFWAMRNYPRFSAGKKLAFFTAPISFASWEARKP